MLKFRNAEIHKYINSEMPDQDTETEEQRQRNRARLGFHTGSHSHTGTGVLLSRSPALEDPALEGPALEESCSWGVLLLRGPVWLPVWLSQICCKGCVAKPRIIKNITFFHHWLPEMLQGLHGQGQNHEKHNGFSALTPRIAARVALPGPKSWKTQCFSIIDLQNCRKGCTGMPRILKNTMVFHQWPPELLCFSVFSVSWLAQENFPGK